MDKSFVLHKVLIHLSSVLYASESTLHCEQSLSSAILGLDQIHYMRKSIGDLRGVPSLRLLNKKAAEAVWWDFPKASNLGNFLPSHVPRGSLLVHFTLSRKDIQQLMFTYTHLWQNDCPLTCLVSHLQPFLEKPPGFQQITCSPVTICVTPIPLKPALVRWFSVSGKNVKNRIIYIRKELTPTNNTDSLKPGVSENPAISWVNLIKR